jgi:uncharacterized protein (DUF302 family)
VEDHGITTLPCRDSVEQVLRRLVAEIEARDLEISAVIDHDGDAADVGLDMPDSKLVVFGHPSRRTPLMVSHPVLALDLPMKLLVWQRTDGAVFLSYNTAEFLAARHALEPVEADTLRIVEDVAEAVASS